MTANPSALSLLAIAKESTPGTYVAPTTANHSLIPQADVNVKAVMPRAQDKGIRGSMAATVWGSAATTRHYELSVKGDVFAGSFGHLLMAAFGTDTVSGAGPYVHTFSVSASSFPGIPTYSVYHYDGVEHWGYVGCRAKSVQVNYDKDGYLKFEVVFLAKDRASQSAPTVAVESGSGFGPIACHTMGLTLGGTADKGWEKFSWELDRGTEVKQTFNGAATPEVDYIVPSPPTGTFQGAAFYDSITNWNRFYNASNDSVVCAVGSTNPMLTLTATTPDWKMADVDPGGVGDIQKVNMSGVMQYSSTDAGICKVALTNSRSTAY